VVVPVVCLWCACGVSVVCLRCACGVLEGMERCTPPLAATSEARMSVDCDAPFEGGACRLLDGETPCHDLSLSLSVSRVQAGEDTPPSQC